MILDNAGEFAYNQPINTGPVGTYLLGDNIDTGAADGFPDVWLVLSIAETFTSLVPELASVQFQLVSDAQSAIATDGSASVHLSTSEVALAQLTAGTVIAAFKLPATTHERYLGLLQHTIGAAFTGGRINAFLTNDPSVWRPYADGVS